MTDDYEPTQEDIEFLNKIDGGYVGYTRPKVDHIQEIIYWEEPDFDTRIDIDQE